MFSEKRAMTFGRNEVPPRIALLVCRGNGVVAFARLVFVWLGQGDQEKEAEG